MMDFFMIPRIAAALWFWYNVFFPVLALVGLRHRNERDDEIVNVTHDTQL